MGVSQTGTGNPPFKPLEVSLNIKLSCNKY
jgi:hypothetical protein